MKDLFNSYDTGSYNSTLDPIEPGSDFSDSIQYKYFNNKVEFSGSVYRGLVGSVENGIRETLEKSEEPVTEFLKVCNKILAFFRLNTTMIMSNLKMSHVQVFEELQEFTNEFLPTVLAYNIERGIVRGVYKSNLNSDAAARFSLSQLHAYSCNVEILQSNYSSQNLHESILSQILNAITTAQGKTIVDQYIFNSQLQYKS